MKSILVVRNCVCMDDMGSRTWYTCQDMSIWAIQHINALNLGTWYFIFHDTLIPMS